MITAVEFFGRSLVTDPLPGTLTLKLGMERLHVLVPAAPQDVELPNATTLREGGPHFYIINDGAANLTIKDDGGNTLVTVVAGDQATAILADNSTSNGSWFFRESTWQ